MCGIAVPEGVCRPSMHHLQFQICVLSKRARARGREGGREGGRRGRVGGRESNVSRGICIRQGHTTTSTQARPIVKTLAASCRASPKQVTTRQRQRPGTAIQHHLTVFGRAAKNNELIVETRSHLAIKPRPDETWSSCQELASWSWNRRPRRCQILALCLQSARAPAPE